MHKVLFFKILDKSELFLEAWIYQYASTMVTSCLEYCLEYARQRIAITLILLLSLTAD